MLCNVPTALRGNAIGVEVTLKDGPFAGKTLFKREGSFDEGTMLHFDGFSYRIEWDSGSFRWIAYCVDCGSL